MPRLRAAVKREAAENGLFDDDAYACGKVAPWVKTVAVAVAKGERANLPPPTGMTTDADLRERRESYRSVLRRIVQEYNDAQRPDKQARNAISNSHRGDCTAENANRPDRTAENANRPSRSGQSQAQQARARRANSSNYNERVREARAIAPVGKGCCAIDDGMCPERASACKTIQSCLSRCIVSFGICWVTVSEIVKAFNAAGEERDPRAVRDQDHHPPGLTRGRAPGRAPAEPKKGGNCVRTFNFRTTF